MPLHTSTGAAYARIEGIGASLPSRVVDNTEMCTYIDSTDEWIQQRTGIRERRWVAEGETVAQGRARKDGMAELGAKMFGRMVGDYLTQRTRAGLPAEWRVGDKTGSGPRGEANDVAVGWPCGMFPGAYSAMLAPLANWLCIASVNCASVSPANVPGSPSISRTTVAP